MDNRAEQIVILEVALKDFQISDKWKDIHYVEFDLKGELNPSVKLDRKFFTEGIVQDFSSFCEEYIQDNFLNIKKKYEEILDCKLREDYEAMRSLMTNYAYDRYRNYIIEDLSDDDLKQGIIARLYRTLAGIYTEYHGFLLARKLLGQKRVMRSIEMDRAGIDFIIKIDGKIFNIHVVVNRKNAIEAKRDKITHKGGADWEGVHIILPYGIHGDLPESTKDLGNGFYLFRESYIMGLAVSAQVYKGDNRVVVYKPSTLIPFKDV